MTTPGQSELADETIALERPPFWTIGVSLLVFLASLLTFSAAMQIVPGLVEGLSGEEILRVALVPVTVDFIALAAVAWRARIRSVDLPPIAFFDTHFTLPPSVNAATARQVSYGDVRGVHVIGQPSRLRLVLEAQEQIFVFPQYAFSDPDGMERTIRGLRSRIAGLPGGAEKLEHMGAEERVSQVAMERRPIVTQVLIGLVLVFFANQHFSGAIATPFGDLRWGAHAPLLIREGEWFRLFASTFLHLGALHLLVVGVVLHYLGSLVERMLGAWQFLLVFFLSSLGAAAASTLFATVATWEGASSAIFGLLGALAFYNWRYRGELPLGFRQPRRWWVVNGVLALGLQLLPMMDTVAHVSGFACGFVVAWALARPEQSLRLAPPAGIGVKIGAAALVALNALGLAAAVHHAAYADESGELRVAAAVIHDEGTEAEILNVVAWQWAIDSRTSSEALLLARDAAKRAVAEASDVVAYRDTLATVEYRLGAFTEAVRIQREVCREASDAMLAGHYAPQLLRFLAARLAAEGPMLRTSFEEGAFQLAVDPQSVSDPPLLRLLVNRPSPEPVTLFAVVTVGEDPLGLVELSLGANAKPSYQYTPKESFGQVGGPVALQFRWAYVELGDAAVGEGEVRWRIWPTVPAIEQYP